MKTRRSEPFPVEAARDLLGILRALYAAQRAARAGDERLRRVAAVAAELRTALDLALECAPGTLGHAAAWDRVELVARRAPDLVDCTTPLEPLLRSSLARLLPSASLERSRR